MRILVADDDTTFRLVLGGKLKLLGHEVTAMETGLHAWQVYQQQYFPVIITDWNMPEMDGLTLSRHVRARPQAQYTYVIMLASRGGKENCLEAMKAGVDDFIPKPPDEDELAARLLAAERIVGVRNHVQQLEAMMAICSYCKRVRAPGNQWVDMEQYVANHLGTLSSHTVCPHCLVTRVQPDLNALGISMEELELS